MKRYIYLISPQKIRGFKFYKELNNILKTNKIKYFQLRLKKISTHNLLKISKKIKKQRHFFPEIIKEEVKKCKKKDNVRIIYFTLKLILYIINFNN